MPKLSKELESLLLSLDKVEPIYERLPDFSPLPFNDTLFIFRRALGGRLRISSDNYVIIGGRGPISSLRSADTLADALGLSIVVKRQLPALLEGNKSFIVLSAKEHSAVIFRGMIPSTDIGLAFLTDYPASAAASASAEEYGYLFNKTAFLIPDHAKGSDQRTLEDFIGYLTSLASSLSLLHGNGTRVSGYDVNTVISRTASIAGCEVILPYEYPTTFSADAAVFSAMMINLLCHVRENASDRRAVVSYHKFDSERVITLEFDSASVHDTPYLAYCRELAARYFMPFAYDGSGVSFIPVRLDPSTGGLKQSFVFDSGKPKLTVLRRSQGIRRE